MKHVDEELAARLQSGAATTCLCWRFTRADGAVFGATDHDRELIVDAQVYAPDAALTATSFHMGADLAPGHATGGGGLSAGFLNEGDLELGLWDGAEVDVWRVDWMRPDLKAHVWSGRIGEVVHAHAGFRADLISRKADLERRIGRVYSRHCDADVGDARCGADLLLAAYRGEGVVAEVLATDRVRIEGLEGFADGWFTGGALEAGSLGAQVRAHAGDILHLARSISVETGAACVVTAGCDKAFSTCRDKFANQAAFQGFPHLPGVDAILAGPSSTLKNDGGKR